MYFLKLHNIGAVYRALFPEFTFIGIAAADVTLLSASYQQIFGLLCSLAAFAEGGTF